MWAAITERHRVAGLGRAEIYVLQFWGESAITRHLRLACVVGAFFLGQRVWIVLGAKRCLLFNQWQCPRKVREKKELLVRYKDTQIEIEGISLTDNTAVLPRVQGGEARLYLYFRLLIGYCVFLCTCRTLSGVFTFSLWVCSSRALPSSSVRLSRPDLGMEADRTSSSSGTGSQRVEMTDIQ